MSRIRNAFPKLFEPAFIGRLKITNRLIMAPMGTRMGSETGGVTKQLIDYYARRALGGVGAIITEITGVDYTLGVGSANNLTLHDNRYLPGHNELVEAVQTQGARIICQLGHVGRNRRVFDKLQPVAPSAIPCPFFNVVPRELTVAEIEEVVRRFVEAAVRAKTAGYDGLELHGAHGYLIAEFMSAMSNHRQDRYGGDLAGRMTFPVEIVQGIRRAVGPDYPIIIRISGDEFLEGGMSLEESKQAAQILERAGVDALDVSAGTYDSMRTSIESMPYAQGWRIYLAEAIKKVVDIPVIGVGVIRFPDFAESILEAGQVDFIALGRALLADPFWPAKAKEGREKEIAPCISCNTGCIGGRIFKGLSIRCAVNPLTGREKLADQVRPTGRKKKVLVVGGGPAGMMAALTAKKRGHEVVLYEKEPELGGQLRLAIKPPGKEKIGWLLGYLKTQIEESSIDLCLAQQVGPEAINREKPDAVILATGARPSIPGLPGVETGPVSTAWGVLAGQKIIENKDVVVVGGGMVGCETALYLAPANRKVAIVEMLDSLASDVEPINRLDLLNRIEEAGIRTALGLTLEKIEPDSLVVSRPDGQKERLAAEAVVLALGAIPVDDLSREIEDQVNEVFSVGDCSSPGKIINAIYQGFITALRI